MDINSPYVAGDADDAHRQLQHGDHRRDRRAAPPTRTSTPAPRRCSSPAHHPGAVPRRALPRRARGRARCSRWRSGSAPSLATQLPWMPAVAGRARSGSRAYVRALPAGASSPNLLLMASVFFALAALTRRMLPVYVGAVVAPPRLLHRHQPDRRRRAADAGRAGGPVRAAGHRQRDPTTGPSPSSNTRLLALQGDFLWNRLLWLGSPSALFAFTYRRFSFSRRRRSRGPRRPATARPRTAPGVRRVRRAPAATSRARASRRLFGALVAAPAPRDGEERLLRRHRPAGVLFIASAARPSASSTARPPIRSPGRCSTVVAGSFALFILVVRHPLRGRAGVARARRADGADLRRAAHPALGGGGRRSSPRSWRIVALLLAVVGRRRHRHPGRQGVTSTSSSVSISASVYGISFVLFACLCSLAVLMHVLIDQKYVGHFAMVVFLVVSLALPVLGVEHHLLRYATRPGTPVLGHERVRALRRPAGLVRALLGGDRAGARGGRLPVLGARHATDVPRALAGGTGPAGPAFRSAARQRRWPSPPATGAFIFWNTNVLNPYRTRFSREDAPGAVREAVQGALRSAAAAARSTAVKTRCRHLPRRAAGGDPTGLDRSPTAPRSPSTRSWCASAPGPPCAP